MRTTQVDEQLAAADAAGDHDRALRWRAQRASLSLARHLPNDMIGFRVAAVLGEWMLDAAGVLGARAS